MSSRKQIVNYVQRELADEYDAIPWLTPIQAKRAMRRRGAMLTQLVSKMDISCAGTKFSRGVLSPGCRSCLEGTWSCLFFTMQCPASCTFCLRDPALSSIPQSNGVRFTSPRMYLQYLDATGMRGVGISGGDPLTEHRKLLRWVSAIKDRYGADMYVWVYTSGMLLTHHKLKALEHAGLDELRINIAATDYRLDAVRLACSAFDRVAVEIPVIPGKGELLKKLLLPLQNEGVRHLNLHELRVDKSTWRPHARRGYHLLHNIGVTILESEETALDLIHFAAEQNLILPINYCTQRYKQIFQGGANLRRAGLLLMESYETMTRSGYIRTFAVEGLRDEITRCVDVLQALRVPAAQWKRDQDGERLLLHPSDFSRLPRARVVTSITYTAANIVAAENSSFEAVGTVAKVFKKLDSETLHSFMTALAGEGSFPAKVAAFESVKEGLGKIF